MTTPTNSTSLDRQFHEAMRNLCDRSRDEAGYNPTQLRVMLAKGSGLDVAKELIRKMTVSEGFVKLSVLKRLDLAVETLVQEEPWRALFTQEELETAKRRLQ